jgi:hypothetical protein
MKNFICFLTISLVMIAQSLNAQWVRSGAINDRFFSFAAIPDLAGGDTNLFAGSNSMGVFRSTDNGTNWTAVNNGLTNLYVNGLFVSGSYLFAGTNNGIWKRPLSDILTDIIPAGSSVKKLSTNQFNFTEGPVWYNDSVLLLSDDGIGSPDIFQYNPVGNQFSTWGLQTFRIALDLRVIKMEILLAVHQI